MEQTTSNNQAQMFLFFQMVLGFPGCGRCISSSPSSTRSGVSVFHFPGHSLGGITQCQEFEITFLESSSHLPLAVGKCSMHWQGTATNDSKPTHPQNPNHSLKCGGKLPKNPKPPREKLQINTNNPKTKPPTPITKECFQKCLK